MESEMIGDGQGHADKVDEAYHDTIQGKGRKGLLSSKKAEGSRKADLSNGAMDPWCQGTSKTGSICNDRVPVELQCIYKGSLKGNGSLLNA